MSRQTASAPLDPTQEFPFTETEFRFLASLLRDQTGIVLNSSKMNMVYARLSRRLRELNLKSFADYCQLIESPAGASEVGTLINALTTNLTRFFREPHHFDHLQDRLLPSLANRSRGGIRRLRIWSAGCSSGEEPYTIAMVLTENASHIQGWDTRILATDLDTTMVATASRGVYSNTAVNDLPPALLRRHFNRQDASSWSANRTIRDLITFKQLNLMDPWPVRGPFDAIFCRNVMIYFDNQTKNQLIARFASLLAPGGFLYIGHSETLLESKADLELDGRTVYRKVAP